jgi:hypothetical protein
VALSGVLAYSFGLVRQAHAQDRIGREVARSRSLDRQLKSCQQFRAAVDRLGQDLIHGRRTLAAAAAELVRTERGQDPELLRLLRWAKPGWSDRALLADNLIDETLARLPANSSEAAELSRRLRAEHRAAFGGEPAVPAQGGETTSPPALARQESPSTTRLASAVSKPESVVRITPPRWRRGARAKGKKYSEIRSPFRPCRGGAACKRSPALASARKRPAAWAGTFNFSCASSGEIGLFLLAAKLQPEVCAGRTAGR